MLSPANDVTVNAWHGYRDYTEEIGLMCRPVWSRFPRPKGSHQCLMKYSTVHRANLSCCLTVYKAEPIIRLDHEDVGIELARLLKRLEVVYFHTVF